MEDDSEPPTISEVIGTNLRQIREANRWTQDECVALLRLAGLRLTQSAIVGIEAGSRSVAIGELVIIAAALGVPIAELLAGEGQVRLSAAASADLASVGLFLRGKVKPAVLEIDSPASVAWSNFVQGIVPLSKRTKELWPEGTPSQIIAAERASDSAAERKAARSLGIAPRDLSILAFRMWGTSLTDKRNTVVSERTTGDTPVRTVQAIRGRVTRDLVVEIRNSMGGD
jgi:transcriptional regulator with XRE-family HTH domain